MFFKKDGYMIEPRMNQKAFDILFYLSGDCTLSYREIGSLVGGTTGNVYLYISMLRNKGYLVGTRITPLGEDVLNMKFNAVASANA